MHTFKFKTNIKCGGCIQTVTPFLNAEPAITSWTVDIADPNKILSVEAANMSEVEVIHLVEKAGFKAESVIPKQE